MNIFFYLNSVDSDEMPINAAFHLGLPCLQKMAARKASKILVGTSGPSPIKKACQVLTSLAVSRHYSQR